MMGRLARAVALDPTDLHGSLLVLVLRVSTALGFAIYVPSVVVGLAQGLYGVVALDTVALGVVAGLLVATSLSARVRATAFCGVCYLLAVGLLVTIGPVSQIFLFGFSILSLLLLGFRAGMCAVVLSTATLLVVGVAGDAAPTMVISGVPAGATSWTVISLNFALIDAALTLAVGAVLATLTRTLTSEIASRMALELAEVNRARLEAQLLQVQKMEAVGQLAGGVAHDFNNLLSVVLSYSELVLADLGPKDPLAPQVEEIRRAGLRAADLTRKLLAFSRQQVIQPTVVDLNELLASTRNMLQPLVGADIELAFVAGLELGRVRIDAGSLEQVVVNLVVNARDAMPAGGKLTIETANVTLDAAYVKTHLDVTSGPHVMLSVTDSGTGLDKATVARAFEPFFTRKDPGKGTGLGLATVSGIVQQSGGSVWVYSELGIGTTFKIYLPRVDAAASAVAAAAEIVAVRGTETVLLVEDDDQVRDVARGILHRHGYKVLVARSPGEGLLVCEQHVGPIQLLLTDVVMPQMTGPALAARLSVRRPAMKVLFMSGYTSDAALRHGVLVTEVPYLQKR